MIRSMTGYGRAHETVEELSITVDIKSLNHKYFDFSARVPREYGFLENNLKNFFQQSISRGKIECFVQIECLDSKDTVINVNLSLADGYIKALSRLAEHCSNIKNDITVTSVSKFPDVLNVYNGTDYESKVWESVKQVAQKALESFLSMREAEGEKLYGDILSRCNIILKHIATIEKKSPETVRIYNEKLRARMRDLLGDVTVDQQRLLTEAAIFADKVAVAEETVRLRSHISQMKSFLNAKESIGKKMDFLVQEMNREANTIGSKSQDIEIIRTVVEIKSEIEKIREQVQNIE